MIRDVRYTTGLILLVVVTILWGSTFAVIKQLTTEMTPSVLTAWRFLIATIVTAPFLLRSSLLSHQALYTSPRHSVWRDSLILSVWLLASYGTQVTALQTTSANRTAFLTALNVILVPVWLTISWRRTFSPPLYFALPLAIGGLGLLCWEGSPLMIGDGWALGCAVTYTGFIIKLEQSATRYAALYLTLAQLLCITALAWLWALATTSQLQALIPPTSAWASLLYLSVVGTALTTICQTVGQRYVPAAEASLVYALEPAVAAVFSFFLIGEQLGLQGMLGAICIVAALFIGQRRTL